ncbi:4,5-dihydroxyphthalate decarboxylase [soil metagenome]
MKPHPLDVAFWNYDRMAALRDGSVEIAGVEARFHSGRIVTDIFKAMVVDRAYDVSELGLSYFLRTMDFDEPPFLAIPVFPVRSFRHSAIYINKASGIHSPQDLAGKTIGELAMYGHDAGVMPKGMLSDEFGFEPNRSSWVIGGIDFKLDPIDWLPQPHPTDVQVRQAPAGADLGAMLESGEIDALISADAPRCVLEQSPKVGRLFEDYVPVERDYYRRTGIFPIMHAVVVTRQLAEQQPEIVKAIYRGFQDAKAACEKQLVEGMTFNNMTVMIPWLSALIAQDRQLLGKDWWPYGIERNRVTLDAFLRYHHEQGLSKRRMRIEDVFVPYLLDY